MARGQRGLQVTEELGGVQTTSGNSDTKRALTAIILTLDEATNIVACVESLAWADQVMTDHPDHLGILITHAYLNNNDRRYDHTDTEYPQLYNPHDYRTPGGVNDGEEIWQKLVRRHPFVLTLNGHVLGDGTGYLASTNDRGQTVHQILANYQFRALGGEAYLRLLEFLPDGRTVQLKTYSPLYGSYLTGPDQQFTLEIDS